jgi:nuclear pore complex protein Nup107
MDTVLQSQKIDSLPDINILSSFATVLRDFKLDAIEDEYDILREFRSIAALKAQDIAEEGVSSEFEDWDLEVKLWHLIEILFSYRYSETRSDIKVHDFNSNIVFEEKFYQSDPKLYEIWLIITWIHQNSLIVEKPSNLPTSKWLNTQLSNTLENLDIDSPIRSGSKIDDQDAQNDELFHKYILELLLNGSHKEASEECERTNNWTLKMILAGASEYFDPVIDYQLNEEEVIDYSTHGIKKKALWRRTVYLLSKNEQISIYERSIYGFLAGDLTPLESSNNWDSDLLIYLNHILTSEVENQLIDQGRIPASDVILTFPKKDLTVQKVLNLISLNRKEESEHPLRILIASIISNKIKPIIHSSLNFVGNIMLGNEDSNEILNESYALRVIVHLTIFVSIIDPTVIELEDSSKLITTYILVLRLYEQYELIPLYVSFLPEIEARNAYSLFLMDLFDTELRSKQLELSRLYNLPLENILKRTVERAFKITESHYEIRSSVSLQETDEVDHKLIRNIEWFIDAKMYSDSIHSIITLFRRFLLNGKIKSLQEFTSRNSIQQLLKFYDIENLGIDTVDLEVSDYEREELLQYDILVDAFNAVDEWKLISSNKNVSNIALSETIHNVSSILYFTINEFLANLSNDKGYEAELVQDLRTLYIPYLIIQLHSIYVEGESVNSDLLIEALELTNLVANETTKFYLLFQNCDRLKEYLKLVAQCAALAAGKNL